MKIVLGTANLNQKYGILKFNTPKRESYRILKYSVRRIDYLDTAVSYTGFNKIAKLLNFKKIKINTKISNINGNSHEEVYEKILKQLSKFSYIYKKKINILFLHKPQEMFRKNGNHLVKAIEKLKKKKIVKKIGYSIYDPKEALLCIKKFKPDVIQAPLNILDTRVINSGLLNFLKKKKIKFQARSIFLQGILADKKILKNKKFKNNKNLICWFNWIEKNKADPAQILIQFILSQKKQIDSVLISSKKVSELKKNLKYMKCKKRVTFPKFFNINNKLIDPRRW